MSQSESSGSAAPISRVLKIAVVALIVAVVGCRTNTAPNQEIEQRFSEIEQNIADLQNSVAALQTQLATVKPLLSRTESLEVNVRSIADPFAFGSMGWKLRDVDTRLSTLELDVQAMQLRQH